MAQSSAVRVGSRFGKLTVVAADPAPGRRRWLCECECGSTKSIRPDHLRSGATTSCGCAMAPPRHDLTGRRVGRLTVLSAAKDSFDGRTRWLCRCDCGSEVVAYTFSLNSGRTRSCGCLSRDVGCSRKGERRTTSTSYRTTHKRVEALRGRADTHHCVDCGAIAQEWSYDRADPREVTEEVRGFAMTYSIDPSHYEARCIPCHRVFDGHWGWCG